MTELSTAPARRRRPWLWAVAGLAIALVAADTAAWWWLSGRLGREATAWVRARRAAGDTVQSLPPERGGWPFAAELVVPELRLGTGGPGGLTWRAEWAEVSAPLWSPARVTFHLGGAQSVQVGRAPPVPVRADRLAGTLDRPTGALVVTGSNVRAATPDGMLRAGRLEVRWADGEARVSLSEVGLPGPELGLGDIDRLDLRARATRPLPRLGDVRAAAAAWRDAGGMLLLDEVSLRWGVLHASGQAELALDAAFRPQGTATLQVSGYAAAIEALVRGGALGRDQGRVAATLLGLLATTGPGGVAQAGLPLRLGDGVLALGEMPLLRLPAILPP